MTTAAIINDEGKGEPWYHGDAYCRQLVKTGAIVLTVQQARGRGFTACLGGAQVNGRRVPCWQAGEGYVVRAGLELEG